MKLVFADGTARTHWTLVCLLMQHYLGKADAHGVPSVQLKLAERLLVKVSQFCLSCVFLFPSPPRLFNPTCVSDRSLLFLLRATLPQTRACSWDERSMVRLWRSLVISMNLFLLLPGSSGLRMYLTIYKELGNWRKCLGNRHCYYYLSFLHIYYLPQKS